jgi:hypothetical protein
MNVKQIEQEMLDLEMEAYSDNVTSHDVYVRAQQLFDSLLGHWPEIDYFNPGEPGLWHGNHQVMPLTGIKHENVASPGEDIDANTFEARIYIEWVRDILDDGWQWGLFDNGEVCNNPEKWA